MARTFHMLQSAYGWTDKQVLDMPLDRIRQACAVIQEQRWHDDVAARRLATAQLRTVCSYIAQTVEVQAGKENTLLTLAGELNLGAGTENPHPRTDVPARRDDEQAHVIPARSTGGPVAVVDVDQLPDGPPSVRAGQRDTTTTPSTGRQIPIEAANSWFGGNLL